MKKTDMIKVMKALDMGTLHRFKRNQYAVWSRGQEWGRTIDPMPLVQDENVMSFHSALCTQYCCSDHQQHIPCMFIGRRGKHDSAEYSYNYSKRIL